MTFTSTKTAIGLSTPPFIKHKKRASSNPEVTTKIAHLWRAFLVVLLLCFEHLLINEFKYVRIKLGSLYNEKMDKETSFYDMIRLSAIK